MTIMEDERGEYATSILASEAKMLKKYPQIAAELAQLPEPTPSLSEPGIGEAATPLIKAVNIVFLAEEVRQGASDVGNTFGKSLDKSDMDSVIKKQRNVIDAELGGHTADEILKDIRTAVNQALRDSGIDGGRGGKG